MSGPLMAIVSAPVSLSSASHVRALGRSLAIAAVVGFVWVAILCSASFPPGTDARARQPTAAPPRLRELGPVGATARWRIDPFPTSSSL
jgi:hypothetical protein